MVGPVRSKGCLVIYTGITEHRFPRKMLSDDDAEYT